MDAQTKGFLPLLLLILAVTFQAVDAKRGEKKEGGGGPKGVEGECEGTYALETSGPVTINAGSEEFCNFTIIGSSTCKHPQLNCDTVNIEGDGEDCEETYLEIADGWGGIHRVCGSAQLSEKGVRASEGARDLFITIVGHEGGEVQCEATCGDGSADSLGMGKKKKVDQRCVCGIQNLDDRIVNGEDAKKYEFPWLAAIVDYGTRTPFCGSALVNDRWILTATHCFFEAEVKAKEIQVLLHAHLLEQTIMENADDEVELGEEGSMKARGWDMKVVTDEDERTIRLDIDEIIMHPLFSEYTDYDAALLRIAQPLDLTTAEATPVCLPKKAETSDWLGSEAIVAGWGKGDENAGATTRLLQKLTVPILDFNDCIEMMKDYVITERMFCAGHLEGIKDSCTGDSGGPLVLQQPNNQFLQIGVVSWGVGCAQASMPGIYVRLTDVGDWLQWHMRKSNPIWCRDSMDAEEE